MKQTSDGGYILGGTSVSNFSGNKTENCIGGNDYWIVKTDSIGNIQWQNTIGGILNDNLTSVMQTADGGFILGGYSESYIFGDKTENCLGDFDYWIVKTDSLGNIQWQNTIGGILEDELFALQQTADGGYILGGKSRSDISGDKTENSQGGYDYWIVKTDSIGNIQWQNTIGGSINDELNSIHQTADGGFILGGFSGSSISGDKTENCLGGYDYWIVKTDSQGNIQWQNTLGGSVNDFMYSVRQTADGGYVLGGNSNSNISGDKSENCLGFDDFWIVKTDVAGNIEWQNTIGGSFIDWMSSVQQTNDGGYILSGSSASNISVDKTENSLGDIDYWVVKLDTAGYIQWQNTIGGSNADRLTSVLETTDGAYVLGGWSWSDISGDKTENVMSLRILGCKIKRSIQFDKGAIVF
ncbi:MAG: T9SS C-terminal target domain-containing protein [Bacteroidetes bacterium]|nr:T9SS C-terminal target domain-containing protein [Bacteroidota bacterium]